MKIMCVFFQSVDWPALKLEKLVLITYYKTKRIFSFNMRFSF